MNFLSVARIFLSVLVANSKKMGRTQILAVGMVTLNWKIHEYIHILAVTNLRQSCVLLR